MSNSMRTASSVKYGNHVNNLTTNQLGFFYCVLLAFQYGLQPIIASKLTNKGVSKTSMVIATELCKIVISAVFISGSSKEEVEKIGRNWKLWESLRVAAIPATLYAIQNLCVQYGYLLLDSMTFNLLNQTKTLSAAFCLWVLVGEPQSFMQVIALGILFLAAITLNLSGPAKSVVSDSMASYHLGLIMVVIASILSGFGTAFTRKALTGTAPRNASLFTAELALYGIVFLSINLFFNSDIQTGGHLFSNWNLYTVIPAITNAFGGVIVGFVTKYAGGVVKGFALIAGIIITGVAQFVLEGKPLGPYDGLAVVLVSISIYLHNKFPYVKPSAATNRKSA